MNRVRMLARLAFLVVTLVATSGCRCDEQSGEAEPAASGDAAVAAYRERIVQFEKALARVASAAATQREERPCDKPAIEKRLEKSDMRRVPFAEVAFLEDYSKQPSERYAAERERWAFLTSSWLRELPPASALHERQAAVDALFAIQRWKQQHGLLVVLSIGKRAPVAKRGSEFSAGELSGWVHLADVASGSVLCSTSFLAESSLEVARREDQALEQALWRDFRRAALDAIEDALRRLWPDLGLVER